MTWQTKKYLRGLAVIWAVFQLAMWTCYGWFGWPFVANPEAAALSGLAAFILLIVAIVG